jgi:transcriptional regulator with XRE-family HTH domain
MSVEPLYKTLGALIRSQRRSVDMAQKVLANRVGLSRATLANIETGRQRVLVHQLYAIAEALGISPLDLLTTQTKAADRSQIPMPSNINDQQKEQIARLIDSAQSNPKSETTTHEKETGTIKRRSSAKSAR